MGRVAWHGSHLGVPPRWYSLGRAYGTRVLEILCRFALDPDSLIRHTKERFAAHRVRHLIVAKFLPGVNPLAAGLIIYVVFKFARRRRRPQVDDHEVIARVKPLPTLSSASR